MTDSNARSPQRRRRRTIFGATTPSSKTLTPLATPDAAVARRARPRAGPAWWRGSLAWRAFATNAAILGLVGAGLILTPLTVSHPVAATEAAILVGGLALMLLVNLALVRRTFAPLDRLTALMDHVDLVNVQGAGFLHDNEVAHLERDLGVTVTVRR